MPRRRPSMLCWWALLAAWPSLLTAVEEHVERRLHAMGTELRIVVEAADRASALSASERALRAMEAAETRLSTWHGDSELTRLNGAAAGTAVELSSATAGDLRRAWKCWAATGGAFDPTIGVLSRVWGLRQGGRQPEAEEWNAARQATGMDGLELRGRTAVRRRAELVIDEGGFGKGAGLAAALAAATGDSRVERVMLDLGGQVAVWSAGASVWRLTIADPRDRQRPVIAVEIDDGSIATSGNSEHFIDVGGERLGHLIDPRSGRPAPDFGSLTVWAEEPLMADCLSSGLYVLGPAAALEWAAARPGVEVLVLEATATGVRARATSGWIVLQVLTEEVELEELMIEDGGDLPGKSTRRRPPEPIAKKRDSP